MQRTVVRCGYRTTELRLAPSFQDKASNATNLTALAPLNAYLQSPLDQEELFASVHFTSISEETCVFHEGMGEVYSRLIGIDYAIGQGTYEFLAYQGRFNTL